jgi:hypothetical protein
LAVRRSDRAGRVGAETEAARLFAVAHRLAVGNRREREPAAALELGPVQIELQRELGQVPGEVRVELLGRRGEDGGDAFARERAGSEPHPRQSLGRGQEA